MVTCQGGCIPAIDPPIYPSGALHTPHHTTPHYADPDPNQNQNQPRRRALSQAAAVTAGGDRGDSSGKHDPFNPTEEHQQLRDMVRAFTEKEVDPQALAFNRREEVCVCVCCV